MLDEPLTRAPIVPFLDLRPSQARTKAAILSAIGDLIDSNEFTNGPHVDRFERVFAAWCGVRECVGVASGLDALRLALLALGVGPGDEVIVPGLTFVATFEAVTQTGATPVPVDVDPLDYTMDADAAAAAVGPRTRALLPVHLYGQMADMRRVLRLAAANGLWTVEDACQAHGATRGPFRAGAAGTAAAFSFYPGKNLGAFGDAGAIVTNDASLAATARALREHGQREKYRHERPGWTSRLDTIQALVLWHKLPSLEHWNAERRAAAAHYTRELAGVGDLVLPFVAAESTPVWHLYVVRTARRDALVAYLRLRGIGAGLHYPEPPHLSAAYASLGYGRGSFPIAEAVARECVSLPIFPGMSEPQLDAVVSAVRDFFAGAD